MINILSWNIRQGGGSRLLPIVKAIGIINAQIIVLSEYRNNDSGLKLRASLLRLGYRYQVITAANESDNSVIIASKLPCDTELFGDYDDDYCHNIAKAEFQAFSVYGMYLPHKKKHMLFDLLNKKARSEEKPMIFCGDFNTGINHVDQKGKSFWYEEEFIDLSTQSCFDAFRRINGDIKEYSWYSHQGNGYRYDHTIVHNDLEVITKECKYIHEHRLSGLSDHSPMLLSLG